MDVINMIQFQTVREHREKIRSKKLSQESMSETILRILFPDAESHIKYVIQRYGLMSISYVTLIVINMVYSTAC